MIIKFQPYSALSFVRTFMNSRTVINYSRVLVFYVISVREAQHEDPPDRSAVTSTDEDDLVGERDDDVFNEPQYKYSKFST